jgi:hypothetical protein
MSRRGRSAVDNCGSSQNICNAAALHWKLKGDGWMHKHASQAVASELFNILYVPTKGNKNLGSFGLNLNPDADRKYLTEF